MATEKTIKIGDTFTVDDVTKIEVVLIGDMIMDNGDCVKSVTYLVDGEYAMTVAWDVFVGKHIDTEKDVDVEVNQLWSYKDILFKVVASENDTVKAVANEGFTWEGIKGNFIANFTFEAEHYSQ